MKISNLTECTTAGAVATVAQPFETVQKRTPEKKLKGSNLLKGIKTSAKYANSLHEAAGEQGVAEGVVDTVKKGVKKAVAAAIKPVDGPHEWIVKDRAKNIANIRSKKEQGVAEGSANEGREPMVGETCFIRNYNGHVVLQGLSGDKARVKFDNGRVETVSRKDLLPQSEKVYSLWEGKGVTEGALTTMQPRGEKPFRPSMDAPKKKYPAIGTVAWEQLPDWKRQELLKKRGHIKEQCLDEAQSFGGALNNALSKVEPGSKLDQKIKNHNRAVKSGSKDNLMTSPPEGYHFKKDGSIALGDNPVQEATKQNDYFKNRKDHEDRINGVPGAPKAKNIKQNSYFKTRKDQEDKITGKKVDEAQIKEDDVVLAPGKGRQFKPGLLNKPEVDEGRFTHGPGGVPLDRQGNAIPPKPPVAPKAPNVRRDANGLTRADYNTVWRKIEDVVGQIFPDGDPIDWLGPWLDRQGIKDYHGGEVLNKACRLNGFKDIYDYYDHFKTADYGYEAPVAEEVDEGRFTHGPGGVPLDRQGNAIPPKPPVAPKAPYVRHDKYGVSKAEYQMIWRKIEDVVGQIFPDGDPIDWLIPWFKQKRMYNLDMGDVLDKACRMNGFKDIYDYYDHFKTADYGYEDPKLKGSLDNGGQVQHGSFKGPRKAEKTDFGSTHIGGGGDKMKASRTGLAARSLGNKIVGLPEEKEKTNSEGDISTITDPELRHAIEKAKTHYGGIKDPITAFRKLTVRGLKHAEETDHRQDEKIKDFEQVINRMKQEIFSLRQRVSSPVSEGEITEDDVVLSADRRKPKSGLLSKPEPTTNPADTVKLDVPLLIRLLEFSKEDAVDDMALHDLAEKLVAGCQRGRTLTMKDYERLVPAKQPEVPEPGMDESLLGGAAAAGIIANDDDDDFQVSYQRQMEEDQTNHKFRILAFLKSNEPGDVGQRKEFTITARTDREAKILAKQRLAARGMEVRELHIIGSEEIA